MTASDERKIEAYESALHELVNALAQVRDLAEVTRATVDSPLAVDAFATKILEIVTGRLSREREIVDAVSGRGTVVLTLTRKEATTLMSFVEFRVAETEEGSERYGKHVWSMVRKVRQAVLG